MTEQEKLTRYLFNRIMLWRSNLDDLDSVSISNIIKTLEKIKRSLSSRLEQQATDIASISEWRSEMDKNISAWLDEALGGAKATLTSSVSEIASMAMSASVSAYNSILSFEGKAKYVHTVGVSKAQIAELFSDTLLDEGVLGEWVEKAFSHGVEKELVTSLRASVIEGKGVAESVRRTIEDGIQEGFEVTKRDATTLVRTVTQTANVNAQNVVFEANKGLLKGYKLISSIDNKTCLACALADGEEYSLKERKPALPLHPRCRCVYVPIAKSWADFGFESVDEFENVTRPWTLRDEGWINTGGRKILETGNIEGAYRDWWATLSEEKKESTSIHGERRLLLESGKVEWSDLWDRHTGQVKPLKKFL